MGNTSQKEHLDGNKPFCERKKLTLGKGRVNVCVIQGDLTREQSDVIVCTANKPLDLSKGQVSKNLLEAAGVSMAAELQSLYPHGIDYDEVAVVSSGNLACRNVYFVALPEAGTSGSDDKTLHKTVTMCLERADRSNFRSLSIPALGTGRLKYHPAMVAAEIIQSVEDFSNSKPGTSVKYVNVVVYDKDDDTSFKAFEGEARSRAGRQINHNGVVSSAGAAISSTILAGLRSLSIMRDRGTEEWFKSMYKSEPCSPCYWTTFHSKKTLKDWGIEAQQRPFIRLPIEGQDFQDVVKLVQDTWDAQHVGHGRDAKGLSELNYTKVKVTRVERIENYELFHKYAAKRQELFKKAFKTGGPFKSMEKLTGSKGKVLTTSNIENNSVLSKEVYHEVNEHYMFHGTDGVDKIAEQGLDCRLAGHTAMFGQGVYCAESSTKSDQYADPKGMRSLTDRKMLLVRTCLGEPFVTSSPKSYARPPCKSCLEDKCRCSNNQFYDSIIGDGSWNFREFIVYNMTDVYPEYIVTYDRV
ncbi:uncharacterized protein LOC127877783 isoform X2 [Dreissena polymorpha]|uniref:Poly [ADP-ribose] polymerase n=1 Tax=Dreissena polymorpha TaxID=45954 RepID=A0A9D4QIY6_DREPO|nr:uncharacterized protein LOC127877783 isoform X2 [Dreissena polymorpha]KAH3832425.1 hypothetical protein DPMN_105712 [Dreissena polymorpha]